MTPDETSETEATQNSSPEPSADRQTDFTRRALIQAGWVAPVILAATLPQRAFAQSGGTHVDQPDFFDGPGGFCDTIGHCDLIIPPQP